MFGKSSPDKEERRPRYLRTMVRITDVEQSLDFVADWG
jgi:hypothetical protein